MHLRGWKDCSPEEMELAQLPFRFPKQEKGVALEQQTPNPCGPDESLGVYPGYMSMAHTQCFNPSGDYGSLTSALEVQRQHMVRRGHV